MKNRIINKRDIAGFVDRLVGQYRVLAPVKRDHLVLFQEIGSGSEVFLDYRNSDKPPKEVFFFQSERLFAYSLGKDGIRMELPPEENKRVIFGIRPCDARSLVLMDYVFGGERYQDVYYLNKRAATIVIGLGCNKPQTTCFCTSVKGGPFSTDGLDLLLVDIGEAYGVQVASDKGEKFLENQQGFEEAGADTQSLMDQAMKAAEASMRSPLKVARLREKLPGMFDHRFWDSLHEKCLGCGICTYLCPTCHCFDIIDEAVDSAGERVRIWDSCQFRLFTQEASGVNPRPTAKERLRQRIMHKFSYFEDNYGETACVGCGRCVVSCPVNLDIRQILTAIPSVKSLK